jgi:hypothetical protein
VNVNQSDNASAFLRLLARARAASANEAWAEAFDLWEQVVDQNPHDARYWQALAEAAAEQREFARALEAAQKVLDLGPDFPPAYIAYRIASICGRLGDADAALEWLGRAFDLGYRDLNGAQTDEAFASIQNEPRFREIVALADTSEFTRDEGWRHDLRLMMRELKRKAHSPYRYVPEAEFDALAGALHERIPALSDVEIINGMKQIVTLLGDGHARIQLPEDHPLAQRALPVQFYLFEEGLFITAAMPDHAELLGARVVKLGDRQVDQLFEQVAPIQSRDNDYWLKQRVPYILRELPTLHALGLIPSPDEAALELVLPDGAEHTVTLPAESDQSTDVLWNAYPYPHGWQFFPETLDSPLPHYIRNQALNYWFEYLPRERTVYFQFNRVRDDPSESLSEFTPRLFDFIDAHDVAKLMIDLRWNNGGNTFLEMPLLHRLIGSKVNRRGALFVIVGRRTFSAAQNGATLIERHTEAIFAGEPTGSSPNFVGETIPIELPYSKLRANVSDLYWQSSWPLDHRTAIAPTLFTPPTFAAYRENRDPALDAILSLDEHLPGF